MSSQEKEYFEHMHERSGEPTPQPPTLASMSKTQIASYPLNTEVWTNWARIASCQPTYLHYPVTSAHIKEILDYARKHEESVKVVGSGHSPSTIACTDGHMINLKRYNRVLSINREECLVKVEAGITLHELNERLHEVGLAIINLGSIDDQTISGAISTGTHGTGIGFGILASYVVELEIILANGSELICSKAENSDVFFASLCSLGALGIISTITMQVVPAFALDAVQFPLPANTVISDIDKLINSADHVRMMWFPHTEHCIVWQANRSKNLDVPPKNLRMQLSEIKNKLVGYYSLEFIYWITTLNHHTEKMIPYVNKLYRRILFSKTKAERDLSYKVFTFDCLFKQYVHEFSIPIENTHKALLVIKRMIDVKQFRVHYPIEIRFTKGDDIWLSPSYGGPKVWIGIIMYRPYGVDPQYQKYFQEFENLMTNLGGRPHWAKVHNWTKTECANAYPKWNDFVQLREKLDPTKIFWNDYMQKVFGEN